MVNIIEKIQAFILRLAANLRDGVTYGCFLLVAD